MTSHSATPGYFTRYENLAFERTDDGVLTMRFHTNGGPITFTGQTHEDLPRALEEIALDQNNRALLLTSTGDSFMAAIDGASLGDIFLLRSAPRMVIFHIPRSGSVPAMVCRWSGKRLSAQCGPSGCCGAVRPSTRRRRNDGGS